ncbi:L,D-transpeptidase family protein [Rhizobium leguminosarum bv. viciae]|nr:L,D-transpeptidase family protein [Rhizobium leguminosarum bv. viciae]NKL06724.1 L,D-transpeptidase family protein [Rhizobium leguminosarum bv. viciae]NKL92863.1 L,D-transpeptidase family protein [Rhizobium leguminosarum bv. viciae]NKM92986.1 L,D-transpeptidase family protein [Rhizobium leguminosarum bv. viciae]
MNGIDGITWQVEMDKHHIARRGLVLGSLALMLSGCTSGDGPPLSYRFAKDPDVDPRYRRQEVAYTGSEPPGTIVVDTASRYLYFVEADGLATRYGVAVGEEGLSFKGEATIGYKAEWPSWKPTNDMIQRKPRLAKYADGVPGGPLNPLGAAALYLYQGGQDTLFRLHGTNARWSIGRAVSNGCIRLTNANIVDLYSRARVGTRVVVI